MSLDNTSRSGNDAVKEGNDLASASQALSQEANQSSLAQEQSRRTGREEMQNLTGGDFQITDQSNGDQPC